MSHIGIWVRRDPESRGGTRCFWRALAPTRPRRACRLPPADIVRPGPGRKPYLRGEPYGFSVSHSGEYWACAVGGGNVGLDLQLRQPCNYQGDCATFFYAGGTGIPAPARRGGVFRPVGRERELYQMAWREPQRSAQLFGSARGRAALSGRTRAAVAVPLSAGLRRMPVRGGGRRFISFCIKNAEMEKIGPDISIKEVFGMDTYKRTPGAAQAGVGPGTRRQPEPDQGYNGARSRKRRQAHGSEDF